MKKNTHKEKYSAFFPYAYHYNSDSIITKNGELIVVIKLTSNEINLFLKKNIENFFEKNYFSDISFWITTIRDDELNLFEFCQSDVQESANNFYQSYCKFNSIAKFTNYCYISLVASDKINILNTGSTFQVISNFDQKSYKEKLDSTYNKLKHAIQKLISELKDCSPRILSVKKNEHGVFYSEIEHFFSKVSNCFADNKLSKNDISSKIGRDVQFVFSDHEIAINRDIENNNQDILSDYLAIFSIKNTPQFNKKELIDLLLDFDFKVIVTEILVPIQEKAKKSKDFEQFQKLSSASNDKLLNEYQNGVKKNTNNFKKQNILTVIGDKQNLDFLCYKVNKKFSDHGVALYRENTGLATVFWAQLPGNFHYLNRLNYTTNDKITNFNNATFISNKFNEKILFSDYLKYQSSFTLKEKQFFLISSFNEKTVSNYLNFFIRMYIGFNVMIFHLDKVEQKANLQLDSKIKKIYLRTIQISKQSEISNCFYDFFSMLKQLFNFDFDKTATDNLAQYFIQNDIECNLDNILNQISINKILSDSIIEKIKIMKDISINEKYNFIQINDENKENFIINTIHILFLGMLTAIESNNNIILFIPDFENLISDEKYRECGILMTNIIKKYNFFLCTEFIRSVDLLKNLYGEENSTILIAPDDISENIYKNLNISDANLEFLDAIKLQKLPIVCLKFEDKCYFTSFDINDFYLKHGNFVEIENA